MLTPPSHKLTFDEFTLDIVRCVLLRGAVELPLRRQSFEVLRYLAEHTGRTVSSHELIEALWPVKPADQNGSVGQCIKEIRRAIGHDARWIIKTVSGRGYAFMAEVARSAPTRPDEASSTPVIPAGVTDKLGAAIATEAAAGQCEPPASTASKRAISQPKRLLAVVLCAVLVAGLWALWVWRHPTPSDSVLTMMAAPTIAVLPFTTLGSPNRPHSGGAGLEAEIRSELARVHRGFDLIIRSATNDRERQRSSRAAADRGRCKVCGRRHDLVGSRRGACQYPTH